MKNFLILITLMGTVSATAATELKKFNLHYRMGEKHLEVPVHTTSYETAIEAGADQCFKFFTAQAKLTHDQKLDAVDVCANPKNI